MAASQMVAAMAMTIQTKTRSRVLMRCGLGAGMEQGMERNCNAENHYGSGDNQKCHSTYLTPHALSLALTEEGPALRSHNFRICFEGSTRLTHQRPSLSQCGPF
jgi:hypothetical protein